MDDTTWDGEEYQARFDRLAASGADLHGEANLVSTFEPATVLDAGCGTGRVAIELARRGVRVTGVDVDPSMLATARRLAPDLEWIEHDLATLDLGRTFDVVVLAGNVPVFTAMASRASMVERCAHHVRPGGVMIAGFQLGRGYELVTYDTHTATVGLELVERWSTWDCDGFTSTSDYAVTIHRRPT